MVKSTPPNIPAAALADARRYAEHVFDALRSGSLDPSGGVTRASYGEGEEYAHELFRSEATRMGLVVECDAACNTYMTLRGGGNGRRKIVIGSHLDSVAQGGNFDGAAGVVAGLVIARMFSTLDVTLDVDLVAMGVRAEESAWFQTSYIGSKAALGRLEPEALDARRVDTQRTLAEHMRELGGDPDTLVQGKAFLDPSMIEAYIELHIEQAPSLVHAAKPLAVGPAIPGNFRYKEIRVVGETAHVGLPRPFRRDALKAAVDFVASMDGLWQEWEAAGRAMALTVGRFHTDPHNDAMTKVPGEVRFSLDVRAYDEEDLTELQSRMHAFVERIERERGVRFHLGGRTTAPVARMDEVISRQLLSIATERGIPAQSLPSPASHDAAVFCSAGVPTGLLLMRNEHGSHNPREAMDLNDFMAGVEVLAHWVLKYARKG